jgi:glycosyltransferase involved in cell wall biosynthesis
MSVCKSNGLLRFYCLGNCRIERNLDGGARIFVETAKSWVAHGHSVNLVTTIENYDVCQRYGLSGVTYTFIPSSSVLGNLYLIYLVRMLRACLWALTVKISESTRVVVYSGSDFWPDSIPGWILKLRVRRVKWVAAFYLFAPNPFGKESPYKGLRRLRGLFYYLSQMPAYTIIRKYADMVWVTNQPDRWKFIDSRLSPKKVVAVQGGVDIKTPASIPVPSKKRFDAVFIGRFHPQKGVLELVDIWRFVCEKQKSAMLALIGVGDLEGDLRKKISDYGLENNIVLFGFKDGAEKLRIFKDSKVVVHPATYDSGGMAACEAMACGLPGVSFDLPALKTYYPKGMLKTPCYDLEGFAKNIFKLLNDETLYRRTAKDALDWAKEWDWDKKSEALISIVQCLFTH